jgi:hypothetical protein
MSAHDESPETQTLDYGRRDTRISKALRFAAITSGVALALVAFATALPTLHNEGPFLPHWLITLLIATPLVWMYWYSCRDSGRSRVSVVVVVTLWGFGTTLGAWMAYSTATGVDPHVITRNRFYCTMHLMGIRNLLEEYVDGNAGKLPDSLSQLAAAHAGTIDLGIFTCPGAQGGYMVAPTTQSVMAQLSGAANTDYVYRGSGLTKNSPPKSVVLHDQLGNHSHDTGPDEVNVLYLDGSMERLKPKIAAKLIKELNGGHNPPRPEMLK